MKRRPSKVESKSQCLAASVSNRTCLGRQNDDGMLRTREGALMLSHFSKQNRIKTEREKKPILPAPLHLAYCRQDTDGDEIQILMTLP